MQFAMDKKIMFIHTYIYLVSAAILREILCNVRTLKIVDIFKQK